MTPIFKAFGFKMIPYNKIDYYVFAGMTTCQKYLREIYFLGFITLCICFSIDLLSTISNPLKSPDKRMKIYHIGVIVNIVGVFFIEYMTIPKCSVFRAFDLNKVTKMERYYKLNY